MTPGSPARAPAEASQEEFERVQRILSLELRGQCPDRIAIGGLTAYTRNLVARLVAADVRAPDERRARQLSDLLADYGVRSPVERVPLAEAALALLATDASAAGVPPEEAPSPPAASSRERPPRSHRAPNEPAPPTHAPATTPSPRRTGQTADLPPPECSLEDVPGIGPARMRLCLRLGLSTVTDLLQHFPIRHVDYPPPVRASELFFQPRASFQGVVRRVEVQRTARGLHRITAVLADSTGEVEAVWFRAGYGLRLAPGQRIAVSGDLVLHGRRPAFENPDWEPADRTPLHTRRLVPVYPTTKGLHQAWLRELIARAVDRWAARAPETLPDWLRAEEDLLARPHALQAMHFPRDAAEAALARRRLAFDELCVLQLAVLQRLQAVRRVAGRPLQPAPALRDAFIGALPFTLTAPQLRVLGEIGADLARPHPMTRLLQGEVGSGKTVVATAAMLIAVADGAQAALMAPTEILADQHLRTIGALFERARPALVHALGRAPELALYTGRVQGRARRTLRGRVAAGEIDVLVGTQAIIQDGVEFRDLALAVADEQHRFGVRQRLALRQKGRAPHLLVMTATPIPRTLALTAYGDLDLSRIDALPPGRKPTRTLLLRPAERQHAYERLRREVATGRQAYVICPLVEDSPGLEVRAAIEEYARLQQHELAGLRLGLVHGRLRSDAKEAAMRAFRDGEVDALIATAVVEVGVDVPNATLMLIEGAERFGLAQLHQFRGRVGRGEHPATCILIAESASPEALQRLQVVVDSTDGFALAEADLRLRGPGDYYGLRQSGLPDFRVADLRDLDLIQRARRAAERLLARDPELALPEHSELAAAVRRQSLRLGDPS